MDQAPATVPASGDRATKSCNACGWIIGAAADDGSAPRALQTIEPIRIAAIRGAVERFIGEDLAVTHRVQVSEDL